MASAIGSLVVFVTPCVIFCPAWAIACAQFCAACCAFAPAMHKPSLISRGRTEVNAQPENPDSVDRENDCCEPPVSARKLRDSWLAKMPKKQIDHKTVSIEHHR